MRNATQVINTHDNDLFLTFYRFSVAERNSRHQYTFLPFGKGPRGCPGQRLASLTMKTAIVYLLRRYVVTPASSTQVCCADKYLLRFPCM